MKNMTICNNSIIAVFKLFITKEDLPFSSYKSQSLKDPVYLKRTLFIIFTHQKKISPRPRTARFVPV